MSCMWIKDGFHFKFNSAQVSGLPTELPTISILESSGLPTELPTELPTISIYVSSGQPKLHGKIPISSPWAAHSTAHFLYFEVVGCPLSCPLFPYKKEVGSIISMAKFPRAAHSAAHWAVHLFPILEVVGCLLSCPLSCSLFLYMEVVGSLICMAQFPWAAHGQPTLLPTCSPWARSGQFPCFSVWELTLVKLKDTYSGECMSNLSYRIPHRVSFYAPIESSRT